MSLFLITAVLFVGANSNCGYFLGRPLDTCTDILSYYGSEQSYIYSCDADVYSYKEFFLNDCSGSYNQVILNDTFCDSGDCYCGDPLYCTVIQYRYDIDCELDYFIQYDLVADTCYPDVTYIHEGNEYASNSMIALCGERVDEPDIEYWNDAICSCNDKTLAQQTGSCSITPGSGTDECGHYLEYPLDTCVIKKNPMGDVQESYKYICIEDVSGNYTNFTSYYEFKYSGNDECIDGSGYLESITLIDGYNDDAFGDSNGTGFYMGDEYYFYENYADRCDTDGACACSSSTSCTVAAFLSESDCYGGTTEASKVVDQCLYNDELDLYAINQCSGGESVEDLYWDSECTIPEADCVNGYYSECNFNTVPNDDDCGYLLYLPLDYCQGGVIYSCSNDEYVGELYSSSDCTGDIVDTIDYTDFCNNYGYDCNCGSGNDCNMALYGDCRYGLENYYILDKCFAGLDLIFSCDDNGNINSIYCDAPTKAETTDQPSQLCSTTTGTSENPEMNCTYQSAVGDPADCGIYNGAPLDICMNYDDGSFMYSYIYACDPSTETVTFDYWFDVFDCPIDENTTGTSEYDCFNSTSCNCGTGSGDNCNIAKYSYCDGGNYYEGFLPLDVCSISDTYGYTCNNDELLIYDCDTNIVMTPSPTQSPQESLCSTTTGTLGSPETDCNYQSAVGDPADCGIYNGFPLDTCTNYDDGSFMYSYIYACDPSTETVTFDYWFDVFDCPIDENTTGTSEYDCFNSTSCNCGTGSVENCNIAKQSFCFDNTYSETFVALDFCSNDPYGYTCNNGEVFTYDCDTGNIITPSPTPEPLCMEANYTEFDCNYQTAGGDGTNCGHFNSNPFDMCSGYDGFDYSFIYECDPSTGIVINYIYYDSSDCSSVNASYEYEYDCNDGNSTDSCYCGGSGTSADCNIASYIFCDIDYNGYFGYYALEACDETDVGGYGYTCDINGELAGYNCDTGSIYTPAPTIESCQNTLSFQSNCPTTTTTITPTTNEPTTAEPTTAEPTYQPTVELTTDEPTPSPECKDSQDEPCANGANAIIPNLFFPIILLIILYY